eukprot:1199509-Rhodomonas_salina.1
MLVEVVYIDLSRSPAQITATVPHLTIVHVGMSGVPNKTTEQDRMVGTTQLNRTAWYEFGRSGIDLSCFPAWVTVTTLQIGRYSYECSGSGKSVVEVV